jgi:hypothetical protein
MPQNTATTRYETFATNTPSPTGEVEIARDALAAHVAQLLEYRMPQACVVASCDCE